MTSAMPVLTTPQTVQITCPNCGHRFQTQVFSLVDVTSTPELKQALLSGQVNTAQCSSCGFVSMLGTPLAYHQMEKRLFLVYIPSELNMPQEEQEQFIGSVTSLLMRSLPERASKSHLLNPRRFLSFQSLIDAVLEADGISREAREKQRQIVETISALAEGLADEQQFIQLVEQYRPSLDSEFFGILNAYIDATTQEGRTETAQVLQLLNQRLRAQPGLSESEVAAGRPATGGEGQSEGASESDLTGLFKQLEAAAEDDLPRLLADNRHMIDYGFFEAWTARIEALQTSGDSAGAQRLTERRQQILELVERMDKEAQAMFEAGSVALQEVMEAEDTRAALQALGERLDDAFMLVLSASLSQAQYGGQAELAARLEQIGELAFDVMQERLTPEERFINELLMAGEFKDSQRMLRNNAARLTPDVITRMNDMAAQYEERGQSEVADTLRRLAREGGALLF